MALFIAEKTGVGSTINVHLDERFKLEENKSANVIGANINLDLLGISSYTKCIEGKETACIEEKHVKLGVSKIFKNQPVAKKVDYTQEYEAAVQKMTVKTAQETAIEPVDITLPPMPFTVLDLKEGETSSVGDFEISVLSIWADHAEFIVKEKSTGINFMFVISKGWNLFAIPGEIRTLGQNECGLSNSRLFEFNAQTQGFDKITEPRPGKAYWLYNPNEKCKADVELVKPVSMYELEQLQKGWNFVPILFGMIGSTLSEMGNCEFNGAFVYDTETNQWNNVLGTEIGRSLLGKGIAVNVQETCSLLGADTIDEIPELPALPEVG